MIMSAKGLARGLALSRLSEAEAVTVTRHPGRRGLPSRSGHADVMRWENGVGAKGKENKSISDRGNSKAKAWINMKLGVRCWKAPCRRAVQGIF